MASFDINSRSFGTEPASSGVSMWVEGRRRSGEPSAASRPSASGPRGAEPDAPSGAAPILLAPPDRQPSDLRLPEPAPRKAGWAIVGLGHLALEEVMPAFRACRLSQPVALVSGHSEKAHTVADAYGIEHTSIYDYESFDRLADNPAVDVVYIVLPNSMHADYTIRALKAGKHVLCERCYRLVCGRGRAHHDLEQGSGGPVRLHGSRGGRRTRRPAFASAGSPDLAGGRHGRVPSGHAGRQD